MPCLYTVDSTGFADQHTHVWHTHMYSHDLTHMFSLDVVPTLSGPFRSLCMQLCHSCPCLRQAHTHSIVYIYRWIHDSRVRLRPVQPSDHYRIGTTGFGLPYNHRTVAAKQSPCPSCSKLEAGPRLCVGQRVHMRGSRTVGGGPRDDVGRRERRGRGVGRRGGTPLAVQRVRHAAREQVARG